MRRILLIAAVAALTSAGSAWAQGYGVFEQSACASGRGGASVASPCPDGSGVYYNPAGLSFSAKELGAGVTFIGPRGDFTNTGGQVFDLQNNFYPVPHFFYTQPVGDRLAAGIGVFAPYGLTTEWANPDTFQGRFLGYKSVIPSI